MLVDEVARGTLDYNIAPLPGNTPEYGFGSDS